MQKNDTASPYTPMYKKSGSLASGEIVINVKEHTSVKKVANFISFVLTGLHLYRNKWIKNLKKQILFFFLSFGGKYFYRLALARLGLGWYLSVPPHQIVLCADELFACSQVNVDLWL